MSQFSFKQYKSYLSENNHNFDNINNDINNNVNPNLDTNNTYNNFGNYGSVDSMIMYDPNLIPNKTCGKDKRNSFNIYHKSVEYNLKNWNLPEDIKKGTKVIPKGDFPLYSNFSYDNKINPHKKYHRMETYLNTKPQNQMQEHYTLYSQKLENKDEKYLETKINKLGVEKEVEDHHYDFLSTTHQKNKFMYDAVEEDMKLFNKEINYTQYYNPNSYESYNYLM